MAIGFVKVVVIVLAGRLFDHPKVGRRPLLIGSNLGLAASLMLLGINFLVGGSGEVAVLSLALYVMFFSLGMGPGAWLIPSEVFSLDVRARAMSLATFSNRFLAAVGNATFLTLKAGFGNAGICLLFAALCLGNAVFIALCLPETRGKSLEDMARYFEEAVFPWEAGSRFRQVMSWCPRSSPASEPRRLRASSNGLTSPRDDGGAKESALNPIHQGGGTPHITERITNNEQLSELESELEQSTRAL
mmetsp:Transcript_16844/g.38975  ORF Transcript_16844/g.38975 Transcript_16844/m.38975 type:complete len:246 (-) Transcript_16844:16-753(-)